MPSLGKRFGSNDEAIKEWLRVQNSHSYKKGINAVLTDTTLLKFVVIVLQNVVCNASIWLSYECVQRII